MDIDTNKAKPKSPSDKRGDIAAPDFNGAAIIDEQGVEVPITEDMVRTACDELGTP